MKNTAVQVDKHINSTFSAGSLYTDAGRNILMPKPYKAVIYITMHRGNLFTAKGN